MSGAATPPVPRHPPLWFRLRRLLGRLGFGLAVLALVSPAVLVFLWMLSLSLKTELDNTAWPPVFIPDPPTLENYREVFARNDFLLYAWNSVVVSVSATGLALLVGVPAVGGVLLGTWLQQRVPLRALSLLFSALLVVVAVDLLIP